MIPRFFAIKYTDELKASGSFCLSGMQRTKRQWNTFCIAKAFVNTEGHNFFNFLLAALLIFPVRKHWHIFNECFARSDFMSWSPPVPALF
ncbi:MAG: hypothetical protein B6245_11485 [Desulfobacteraceae bacterium 4572_88]|nr:MAG: hypothetical protein B6245_11485 [Desulfobacteraceae bacterium 4572_88]